MAMVAAASVTLLPAHRSLRTPGTGINPRPVRMLQRGLGWLSNLLSGLALIAFLGLAVGPHVFGYRTQTMLTGSMAPRINVGDMVVVVQTPMAKIVVGDVFSYQIPVEDHRVVSHRVVAVAVNPDGSYTVRTKGDANAAADPWEARITSGQVWQVRGVVPYVGTAIRALREPAVSQALRIGAPTFFVLLVLSTIWRRPKTPAGGLSHPDRQHTGRPR